MIEIRTLQNKIRAACAASGITLAELAERLGVTQSSFSQRLKTGKFTQEELEAIGRVLDAEYRSGFYYSDGSKIE